MQGLARSTTVVAAATGYIQNVDSAALLDVAREHDSIVRLPHAIGDFVIAGHRLIDVHAVGDDVADIATRLRRAVSIGPQRTVEQDVAFGLRQIVAIALKALSPAINDPTTANACLDYLSSLVARLARREFPSPFRTAGDAVRVIASRPSLAELVDEALEEVRLAAREQPAVMRSLVIALATVAAATDSLSRRNAVFAMLARVRDDAAELHACNSRNQIAAHVILVEELLNADTARDRRSRPS